MVIKFYIDVLVLNPTSDKLVTENYINAYK